MPKNVLRYLLAFGFAAAVCGMVLSSPKGGPTLRIDDRVDRFQRFYTAAAKLKNSDGRFKLWQKLDGLAAVPPGKAGNRLARQLLDSAWLRYASVVPKLPQMSVTATAEAQRLFSKDVQVLAATHLPLVSRLVLYVGQFDNNAFTVPPMQGRPATVLMPVENNNLQIALAHELAHSIHMQLAHVRNSFGAPIGELVFLEGMAMRVSQQAVPGRPEAAYAAMPGEQGWLANCYRRRREILTKIVPDLDSSGAEIAMKYTFGHGNTGMTREAYCVAWIVMGSMQAHGHSLAALARIPENQMILAVREEIGLLH